MTGIEKFVEANGVTLAYEEFGNTSGTAVILIAGMSTQMYAWPDLLCESLAETGCRVIRFDNRDSGLSGKTFSTPASHRNTFSLLMRNSLNYKVMDSVHQVLSPALPSMLFCTPSELFPLEVPYDLNDMAEDTLGLMTALGIRRGHIIGASMGGMIGQICAIKEPERIISLTSIMSTSGAPYLPGPDWKMTRHFIKPQPKSKKAIVERSVQTLELAQGRLYRQSPEVLRQRVLRSYRRSHHPEGTQRHMYAIAATPSRLLQLRQVETPTLVIHGTDDPMVPLRCGISTARYIAGSTLDIVEGMGHDLTASLVPRLLDSIVPLLELEHAA